MHPNVKAALDREYAAQKSEEWLALRGKMNTTHPKVFFLRSVALVKSSLVTQLLVTVSYMRTRHVYCTKNDMERLYTNSVSVPIQLKAGLVEALTV